MVSRAKTNPKSDAGGLAFGGLMFGASLDVGAWDLELICNA